MPPHAAIPSTIRTLPQIEASPTSQFLGTLLQSSGPAPSTSQQITLGYGIPPIPSKTRDKILAGEYIEFSELPPAKGKSLSPSAALSALEGNILLVNPADLHQQKKVIPDLGIWVQCFSIYMGVICSMHPERLPDLIGYMCHICRASERYRWPSWVVFDQNFRQTRA